MNCYVCLAKINKVKKYSSYHDECFREVFGTTKINPVLPFNRSEFKTDKAKRNNKRFSISGVQPKLLISIQEDELDITETKGTHILKISPEEYPYAAENEHLTMEIIRYLKIDTALCGLMKLKNEDGESAYITKRFDRDDGEKVHQEDMMQAMGLPSDSHSKYESKSYEDVGKFLFDKGKNLIVVGDFFRRVVLNFLLGNDDFHLKNISIRPNPEEGILLTLTPLYDSLNTMIYGDVDREMAMALISEGDGYTKHFCKYGYHTKLCFDEFAEKIGLNKTFTKSFYKKYLESFDEILNIVERSFLPKEEKDKYKKSITERYEKFFKPGI